MTAYKRIFINLFCVIIFIFLVCCHSDSKNHSPVNFINTIHSYIEIPGVTKEALATTELFLNADKVV